MSDQVVSCCEYHAAGGDLAHSCGGDQPLLSDRVRVHVEYSDGHYTMSRFTTAHERAGLDHVEITAHEWRAYQLLQTQCRQWHDWMRALDNEQFAKKEAR